MADVGASQEPGLTTCSRLGVPIHLTQKSDLFGFPACADQLSCQTVAPVNCLLSSFSHALLLLPNKHAQVVWSLHTTVTTSCKEKDSYSKIHMNPPAECYQHIMHCCEAWKNSPQTDNGIIHKNKRVYQERNRWITNPLTSASFTNIHKAEIWEKSRFG